jgi:hypothetical protein
MYCSSNRCGTKGVTKVQKNGMYEHQFGGAVIVTEVTDTTVTYSNVSVSHLETGEIKSKLELFNRDFHYVVG